MAGGPTRQDTYSVTVLIKHPTSGSMINYGVFDKMSGGALSAGATSYNPGGMQPPVSLGGKKVTSNVTVSRLYRLGRDHDIVQQLLDSVGKSDMTIVKQPLDIDGNVYGRPITYKGKLDRVAAPDVDSESSTAALIELEMVVEGYPTS